MNKEQSSNKADSVNNQSPHPGTRSPLPAEKKWLAAYTRIHHEKKVRDRLLSLGIQHFLPTQTVVRQWSDRKKKIEQVLIPMMIFVYVDIHEQRQVLELPSVLHYMVLRGEHTPAQIPNSQMERFRFMVERSQSTVSFDADCMQIGQEVRVVQGPLQGLTGTLVTIKGKSNIAIQVDKIGCAVVEISADFVEPVNSEL